MSAEVTVGIDIGTSSVKALAVDADGHVVRRSRVPHPFRVPAPLRFEHDARLAWYDGPRAALAQLAGIDPIGVSVAAMVPSLTAVDASGVPVAPGLLYGDERGAGGHGHPGESGELSRFLAWLAREYPGAAGYWPAQAVANAALAGEGALSTTAAAPAYPLFNYIEWDPDLVTAAGARVEQLPRLVPGSSPAGRVAGFRDCALEGGTIDALGEQIVAGIDSVGDVLVILGTTLITWCVMPEPTEVPGYYTVPHTTAGCFLHGGPSNAGGLFLNWVQQTLGGEGAPAATDPERVPVWVPYPRGERVPFADPSRRAQVVDLDLTHDAGAIRRAAFEAAGFVVRRTIAASPVPARRIVATGGGVRVAEWVQALADCTGMPVEVVAVPEGGALGAAFLARIAAGRETNAADARRWARIAQTVDPDPAWADALARRYARFLEVAS